MAVARSHAKNVEVALRAAMVKESEFAEPTKTIAYNGFDGAEDTSYQFLVVQDMINNLNDLKFNFDYNPDMKLLDIIIKYKNEIYFFLVD